MMRLLFVSFNTVDDIAVEIERFQSKVSRMMVNILTNIDLLLFE